MLIELSGRITEMRLLIVSQYFWPENFRINDLAVEFSRRGHEVVVLTGLPNYPNGFLFEEYRNEPGRYKFFQSVEIIRVPLITRGQGSLRLIINYLSFAISASLFGIWKLRKRNFDLILVNQLSPVTVGLPAALLARLWKVPIAMWVLDLWPDTLQALEVTRSAILIRIIKGVVAFLYKQCDLILAQSRSFIPKIRELARPDQVVEYLPSWAEDIFKNGSYIPAPEVPFQDDFFDIMFAGNIGESQDFPCIIDAAEKLRKHNNIRWIILGDGRMKSWVKQEIERRKLHNQVLMLGQYPLERMPSFFMCADALLVTLADKPIFALTIPGKLQSYLTAGIPIVAALNGEGAEMLRSAKAGITAPAGDYKKLAQAVLELSRMTVEERKKMGQNCLNLGLREFNRKMVIDRIECMLNELCYRGVLREK